MPHGTGGDRCPTPVGDMAVDQYQRVQEGMGRTAGDGWWLTTDLAVGGSNPSRRANVWVKGIEPEEMLALVLARSFLPAVGLGRVSRLGAPPARVAASSHRSDRVRRCPGGPS